MKHTLVLLLLCSLVSCKSRDIESTQQNPFEKKIILTEIAVEAFPPLAAFDEPWDTDSSGPDMSLQLYEGNSSVSMYGTDVQNNITKEKLPVTWATSPINLAGKQWRLVLNDHDEGMQQQMAQLTFNGNDIDTALLLKNTKGYKIRLRTAKE